MAGAFVQSLGWTANSTAGQTTTVLSISKTITSGNTVVVGWGSTLGGGATGATDNLGNTYTKVEAKTRSLANAEVWSAPVTSAGSLTTITVSHPSSQYVRLWAAEFSGVAASPAVGGGTTDVSAGPVVWMSSGTIPANGLAVGFETHGDSRAPSAGAASGSPSTTIYLSDTGNDHSSMAYAVAGGSSVTSFTGTIGIEAVLTNWAGAGAIFSPSGGATNYTRTTSDSIATLSETNVGVKSGIGTYPEAVLADSPVLYLRMGESSGDLADSSGRAHTATVSGTLTYGEAGALTGDTNKAIRWPGVYGTYATVAAHADFNLGDGPFSVEFWARRNATGTTGWVFDTGQTTGTDGFAIALMAGGTVAAWDSNGASMARWYETNETPINDLLWHHVVITKTGSTRTCYVDGAATTTAASNITLTSVATDPVWIGTLHSDGTNKFDGWLDELAIYSTVLSPTKIAAHYAAASSAPPSAGPITGIGAIASGQAFGVITVGAGGTVKYISPTGNDSTGAGSFASPWRTLAKFYATAVAGDLLYCRVGTYTNTEVASVTSVGTSGSPITVRAYPSEVPVFAGEPTGSRAILFQNGAAYHSVEGLQFENFTPLDGGVIEIGATGAGGTAPVRGNKVTPTSTITVSSGYGVQITANNQVVENLLIVGPGATGSLNHSNTGIYGNGAYTGVIIRNCTIRGFKGSGIWLQNLVNPLVEDCTIEDVQYAGIFYIDVHTGMIRRNLVQRVGYVLDPSNNNAYGIGLDSLGQPPCSDVAVEDNTVTDVTHWHGIDTHAGQRCTFRRNIVKRSPRAFFITMDSYSRKPTDCIIDSNYIAEPVQVTGGTDPVAITTYASVRCAFTNNVINADYTSYGGTTVYDYAGASTSLTQSGNVYGTSVPGGGIPTTTTHITVKGCTFTASSSWIASSNAIRSVGYATDSTIEDCLFLGPASSSAAIQLGGATPGPLTTVIQRCIFDGTSYGGWAQGIRIAAYDATASILHCSFIDGNVYIRVADGHSTLTIRDNAGGYSIAGDIVDASPYSASTTQDHNFWDQAWDGYYLDPLATGKRAASDGSDAGALQPGAALLALAGIPSAEAFGTVTLTGSGLVGVGGIASAESFGLVRVGKVTPAGAPPITSVFIDWAQDGAFNTTGDDVSSSVLSDSISWTRGRNADFSGEATGSASFSLINYGGQFNPNGSYPILPGLPVQIIATYLGTVHALFYGFIQRVSWDAAHWIATVTCYDMLQRFAEIADASVRMSGRIGTWPTPGGTARDHRVELLTHAERGNLNLCLNGACATNTGGWDGSSIARITSDHPTGSSSTTCAEWTTTSEDGRLFIRCSTTPVAVGEKYTLSFWVRTTDATTRYLQVGLSQDQGVVDWEPETTVITSTWTRYVYRYTGVAGTDYIPALRVTFWAGGLGGANTYPMTIRIGDVMVTRGTVDRAYAVGTGRWNNLLSPGSFEADDANPIDAGVPLGWYPGWTNRITNGSFETNTSGWSGAQNGLTLAIDGGGSSATATLTRTLPNIYGYPSAGTVVGSYVLDIYGTGYSGGGGYAFASYALSGTFTAGTTYTFGWTYRAATAWSSYYGGVIGLYLGSSGAPTDRASCDTWNAQGYGTWTPTANRTDAVFVVTCAADYHAQIDGVWVTEGLHYEYGDGPGSIQPVTSYLVSTAQAKYGAKSMAVVTTATAKAGVCFLTEPNGLYLVTGYPYTLSLWFYCAAAMPIKVGLAAKNAGLWDEQSTTVIVPAATWTRVTVPLNWTYDLVSSARTTYIYVQQTDATARTFYVDGMRLAPGSVDDYEMAQWDLDNETDAFYIGQTLAAPTVLQGLATINEITFARHWIIPKLTSPYWQYVVQDRATRALATSVETFIDGDFNDLRGIELDREWIVNLVEYSWGIGSPAIYYVSDEASVNAYGPRMKSISAGTPVLVDETTPADVATTIVAGCKDPVIRPQLVIQNRFPSQLEREVGDIITVTCSRVGVTDGEFSILSLTTSTADQGNLWTTVYQLEESTY